jgi:hypothetical protein
MGCTTLQSVDPALRAAVRSRSRSEPPLRRQDCQADRKRDVVPCARAPPEKKAEDLRGVGVCKRLFFAPRARPRPRILQRSLLGKRHTRDRILR